MPMIFAMKNFSFNIPLGQSLRSPRTEARWRPPSLLCDPYQCRSDDAFADHVPILDDADRSLCAPFAGSCEIASWKFGSNSVPTASIFLTLRFPGYSGIYERRVQCHLPRDHQRNDFVGRARRSSSTGKTFLMMSPFIEMYIISLSRSWRLR